MMWGYGYEMGWIWILIGLLVIAGIVAVVLALALPRRGSGAGEIAASEGTASAAARQLLDERYARGEIDTAEYRERRAALDGG